MKTETAEYQMDGDIDRIATKRNEDNIELYAYCTTDHVRVGFEGNGGGGAVWVPRDQVIEFIAILSRIVYSKPPEQPVAENEAQQPKDNYEPPDDPVAWSGGFAANH